MDADTESQLPLQLGDLLRQNERTILDGWERAVRALPIARELSRPVLIDHVPELLAHIARLADELSLGRSGAVPREVTAVHAIERLDQGFDLPEVVAEYAALREVIGNLLAGTRGLADPVGAARIVNSAIDDAIAISVQRFERARDRTLQGLDRISNAFLESENLSELLQQLLQVFLETTAAVDTAVILLREGELLRVRAAAGIGEAQHQGFTLRLGEGFSGTVAENARSLMLKNASEDPLVVSPVLSKLGLKALYGVPLLEGSRVIGVAHIGSKSANDFSDLDRRLFNTLASRATAAISRAMMRQRLELERNRYLDLVDHLDHAVVWEADAGTLRFTFVSQRTRVVTGSPPEAWLEDPDFWSTQVPAEDRARVRETIETCLREGSDQRTDHRLFKSDGSVVWVHTGVHVAERNGARILHGITLDVSELVKAVQSRDEILAIVTHDLRTPLGSIRLDAGALARGAGQQDEHAARNRRIAERILRSSERMDRLISDLSDYASIAAGRLSISTSSCRLGELVHEVAASMEQLAREREIELRTVVAECHSTVCDRDRIAQVLANLLSNAFNVTPPKGTIELGLREDAGELVCWVKDTGPGIPEEDLPSLFDRYFRGRASSYKGTGLGLAISKAIVLAHQGRIWVESEPGVATTFSFSLPVLQSAS